MHLELTFLFELTVKEDLHGAGSLSPLPYPVLSVTHGLQIHTKHPFPGIWIGLVGSFSVLNLCSACFLASTQSLEIHECSKNTFPGKMPAFSCVCVCVGEYCLSCLMLKTRFFFKLCRRWIVVGRRYIDFYSCEHKNFTHSVPSCWVLNLLGEMRRIEMRGMGRAEVNSPAHQMSPSPSARYTPFALLPLLSTLLQLAFCLKTYLHGLLWWTRKLLASFGLSWWGTPAGNWREGRKWGHGG